MVTRWPRVNRLQPYRPGHRPILLICAVCFAATGCVFLALGAVEGGANLIRNGLLWIGAGVLTFISTWRRYPRGFQLPDDVDPSDEQQIKAALKRYRQERHSHR
jgi:hypothetical protein